MDVAKAIEETKAGKVEYRLDKTNIIHTPIGKVSFGGEKLNQNFTALMEAILKAKPAGLAFFVQNDGSASPHFVPRPPARPNILGWRCWI